MSWTFKFYLSFFFSPIISPISNQTWYFCVPFCQIFPFYFLKAFKHPMQTSRCMQQTNDQKQTPFTKTDKSPLKKKHTKEEIMNAWHKKKDPNFDKFESGNHAIYAISRPFFQKEIFLKRILKQRESLWTAKWQAESDAKTRTRSRSFLFCSVYLRRWNQHRYFSCVYAMLSFWRRGTWGPQGSWDSGTVSCADLICVCWTARPTNKRFQSQIKTLRGWKITIK